MDFRDTLGCVGASQGLWRRLKGLWRRLKDFRDIPEVCGPLNTTGIVRVPPEISKASQVFIETPSAIVRTLEGLWRALGCTGCPCCSPAVVPSPTPPQGRPQREAGRAEAAGGVGPVGLRAGWPACVGRAGGAAPQRSPRLGRPAPPVAMAWPRGLGCIPELQPVAFPAAAAAAVAEDEAFLPEPPAPRAPRWPRSPPSSPVFFASPSPTLRRRLRLFRNLQEFGHQAWAG